MTGHLASLRALYEGWSPARLTPRAVALARMGIADTVGCIVAGARYAPARIVRDMAIMHGGGSQASVLGLSMRLPAPLAALCNGVAGHLLDYDDMSFVMVGHPSVVLAPALLALGEARRDSGHDVLDAYVLGFEVDMWFARRMVPAHYDAGWHATSSIGILGATAGAAMLMELDADVALHALAIAASQAAGLRANFGSMTKSLHAGQAAEAGLRCAMLAAEGFRANPEAVFGPGGFIDMYGANAEPLAAPATLGIEAGGIALKAFACCGAGQTVVEAAREARAALEGRAIEGADLVVSPRAASIMPYRDARDALQAKYCLAYCAAVGLLDGAGGLAQFDDDRVRRADVQALMKRVRVSTDAGLASGGGRFGVDLTVRVAGRAPLRFSGELPPGHMQRPLAPERIEAKFLECTVPAVGEARARDAFAALQAFETLPNLEAALAPLCPSR